MPRSHARVAAVVVVVAVAVVAGATAARPQDPAPAPGPVFRPSDPTLPPKIRVPVAKATAGSGNDFHVPLELDGLKASDVELRADALAGRSWATRDLQDSKLKIQRGEMVAIRPKSDELLQLKSPSAVTLPGTLIWVPDKAQAHPISCEIQVLPSSAPMTWDPTLRAYATRLAVWVSASSGDASFPKKYEKGVSIVFSVKDGFIDHETVLISKPGTEAQQKVVVAAGKRSDRVRLTAVSDWARGRCEVDVGRTLSSVELRAESTMIRGLGLESVPLHVLCASEDAEPFAPTNARPLITCGRGSLSPWEGASVLDGHADLRSSGIGDFDAMATVDGRTSPTLRMKYYWPWAFTIATLGFGAAGGLVKRLRSKGRRSSIGKAVAVGTFAGTMAVAAAVLGINVFAWAPSGTAATEVGAALLAGMAGYGGFAFLDGFGKDGKNAEEGKKEDKPD